MATARSSTVAMSIDGLAPTLRVFNTYGKDANKELRAASKQIADETVQQAKATGSGVAGPAPLAASSLRATSDRVPSLAFGGSKRVGSRRDAGRRSDLWRGVRRSRSAHYAAVSAAPGAHRLFPVSDDARAG